MHKAILLLALSLTFLFLSGCATNPITGESEFMLISSSHEKRLGDEYAPVIEKELGGKIENAQLQSYITDIGAKIVNVSHTPGKKFEFAALNDTSVNAMALPGGYIYITRGMLDNLTSEAQLASILAHEAAHVTARHISSAMSKQIGMDIMLSAVASKAEIPKSAYTLANYGRQIIGLKFSRDDEREADIGGLNYMIKAGYNPMGFVEVMQILDEQSKSKPIEFLSSHPLPATRKAEIKMRIRNKRLGRNLKVGENEYKSNVLNNLPDKS